MSEDPEFPTRSGDLSTYALQHAIDTLRTQVGGSSELVDKALATISLVAFYPRSCPWYGVNMPTERGSVELGVVLRNAFEAVGDYVDGPREGAVTRPFNWFTQLYADPWRQGKKAYNDFLLGLSDPLRYEKDKAGARMSDKAAAAEYARIHSYLRGTS